MNIKLMLMARLSFVVVSESVKFDDQIKAVTIAVRLSGQLETKNIPFSEIESLFNTPTGEPDQTRTALPG